MPTQLGLMLEKSVQCGFDRFNIRSMMKKLSVMIVINQDDWKDEILESNIDYKLKVVGISVEKIKVERSNLDLVKSCLVTINPIPLKQIDLKGFPFRKWTWKKEGIFVLTFISRWRFCHPTIQYLSTTYTIYAYYIFVCEKK